MYWQNSWPQEKWQGDETHADAEMEVPEADGMDAMMEDDNAAVPKRKSSKDKGTNGKKKAVAKAKSKPSVKPSTKGSSKASDADVAEETEVATKPKKRRSDASEAEAVKATFARRYRPSRAFPAAQWDSLKAAFESYVSGYVDLPSTHEATDFKSVFLVQHMLYITVLVSIPI